MIATAIVTAAVIDSKIFKGRTAAKFWRRFFCASRLPLRAQKIEGRKNFHRKPQAANESALRLLRIPL
jgi:hypothetical protein